MFVQESEARRFGLAEVREMHDDDALIEQTFADSVPV